MSKASFTLMNPYLQKGREIIPKPRQNQDQQMQSLRDTMHKNINSYSASILLMRDLKCAFQFIKHENLKCTYTFTFVYQMNEIP